MFLVVPYNNKEFAILLLALLAIFIINEKGFEESLIPDHLFQFHRSEQKSFENGAFSRLVKHTMSAARFLDHVLRLSLRSMLVQVNYGKLIIT